MDAVQAAGKQADHLGRLLAAAEEMTEVGAGTDPGVVLLDRREHVDRLVVAMRRAVVVDRDPDVELLHEVVEAREGIRVGIGTEDRDAGGLREGEEPAVGRGVLGEPAHAVGRHRQAEVGDLLPHGLDCLLVVGHRKHARIELDELQAQVLDVAEGDVDREPAKRIHLDAEVRPVVGRCGQAAAGEQAPGHHGTGGEKRTAVDDCGGHGR